MKRTDDIALAHQLLDQCMFATLSMVDAQGEAYCVPVSPARTGDSLYFHCGHGGRKIEALRNHNKVCLSCVGKAETIPGQFNIAFQSAVLFGTAEEVTDPTEKYHALELICGKYCPDDMAEMPKYEERYRPATAIWKITLEEITTKG